MIHMYPAAKSNAKFVYKHHCLLLTIIFPNGLIRGAPVEHNTASEGIMYGSKILQLYEYDATEYGYEARRECYPTNTSAT